MSIDDLRVNEKRWRRRRLFQTRRPRPVARIVTILFILVVLVTLALFLDLLPFDLPIREIFS